MPRWLGPLIVFCGFVGFIGYAFRQGMGVKPDKNGRRDDAGVADTLADVTQHGSDGHY